MQGIIQEKVGGYWERIRIHGVVSAFIRDQGGVLGKKMWRILLVCWNAPRSHTGWDRDQTCHTGALVSLDGLLTAYL